MNGICRSARFDDPRVRGFLYQALLIVVFGVLAGSGAQTGSEALGLPIVRFLMWREILVSLLTAVSLPRGVACTRQTLIEFIVGVPLITILFVLTLFCLCLRRGHGDVTAFCVHLLGSLYFRRPIWLRKCVADRNRSGADNTRPRRNRK